MEPRDADNQESTAMSARGNTASLQRSLVAKMTVPFANGVQTSTLSTGTNAGLLLFAFNSVVLQMVLGQDHVIARFSTTYWALVLPAVIIPCWSVREIIKVLGGPGISIFAFFVCAGSIHLARGDFQAVAQLFLLVWVVAWCACDSLRLTTADLVKLFVGSLVLGILLAFFTDINPWGLIPGRTLPEYGTWRVSFFPHVANSGVLCLIALMFLTRKGSEANSHKVILAVCIYFILFGFVRTVLVASALYLFLRLIFRLARTASQAFLFGASVAVTIGSILCEWSMVPVLEVLQWDPLVSRLFMRGESGLDPSAIYEQLYRPWLWKEQLLIFVSSPHFMGLGTFKLLEHVSHNLVPGLDASGSESFPTRLLAVYGLPAVFFLAYLLTQLWRAAQSKDVWACACFPAIVFVMMNWGSVFHPTNALFVLFFLLLKGRRGLVEDSTRAISPRESSGVPAHSASDVICSSEMPPVLS